MDTYRLWRDEVRGEDAAVEAVRVPILLEHERRPPHKARAQLKIISTTFHPPP